MRFAVEGDPAPAHRRLQDPHRLVLADRAHRQPGPGRQDLHRPSRLLGRDAHASTIPGNTVTVNTVIVADREIGRLVELLRAEPGFARAELAGLPQPLTGGFWASMSLVRLANVAPPADTLVLRVMPDPALAAKETAVQREITRQGFPAAPVRLSGGADAGLGGAFMLMDRAPGALALRPPPAIVAARHRPRGPAPVQPPDRPGALDAARLDLRPHRRPGLRPGVHHAHAPPPAARRPRAAPPGHRGSRRGPRSAVPQRLPPSRRHHPGPADTRLAHEPARTAHPHRARQHAPGLSA